MRLLGLGGRRGTAALQVQCNEFRCYRQGEEYSYAARQDKTRHTRASQATGSSVIPWARRGAAGRRHRNWRNLDATATATAAAGTRVPLGEVTPATSRMVDGCGASVRGAFAGKMDAVARREGARRTASAAARGQRGSTGEFLFLPTCPK